MGGSLSFKTIPGVTHRGLFFCAPLARFCAGCFGTGIHSGQHLSFASTVHVQHSSTTAPCPLKPNEGCMHSLLRNPGEVCECASAHQEAAPPVYFYFHDTGEVQENPCAPCPTGHCQHQHKRPRAGGRVCLRTRTHVVCASARVCVYVCLCVLACMRAHRDVCGRVRGWAQPRATWPGPASGMSSGTTGRTRPTADLQSARPENTIKARGWGVRRPRVELLAGNCSGPVTTHAGALHFIPKRHPNAGVLSFKGCALLVLA